MMGIVVGDALGMPIQFAERADLKFNPLKTMEALECVHQVSSLTHNHMRSKMACGIYYFMEKRYDVQ